MIKYLIWRMITYRQTYCYVIKDWNDEWLMSTVSDSQTRTRNRKSASWWVDHPEAKIVTISLKEVEE